MKRYVALVMCTIFLSATIMGGAGFCADQQSGGPVRQAPASDYPFPEAPVWDDIATIEMPPADYSPIYKAAAPNEGNSVLFDIAILRPAGIIACALGLVASVAALPFSIPSGSTDKVGKTLIADPFAYTFSRPLGQN
jgi:hypothetical protein